MDNALFQKIDKAMTKALAGCSGTKKNGIKRRLTGDQKEAICESICLKHGVTGDDFFLACMERATV